MKWPAWQARVEDLPRQSLSRRRALPPKGTWRLRAALKDSCAAALDAWNNGGLRLDEVSLAPAPDDAEPEQPSAQGAQASRFWHGIGTAKRDLDFDIVGPGRAQPFEIEKHVASIEGHIRIGKARKITFRQNASRLGTAGGQRRPR